jgi:hypothetical protein
VIYSRRELAALREAAEQKEPLLCPGCRVGLVPQPVSGRPPVAYVRDRVWYRCPECGRSAVLDRRG